ncbi:MAG: UxaA family hydrolase [bacterium]|nr:UxaA family hydrolase [bacterium]
MKPNALLIDPSDNVVTLLRAVPPGKRVVWAAECSVIVGQELPVGHKVAIEQIAPGAAIRKYGVPIGTAGEAITPGDWVHTHNLEAVGR